MLNRQTVYLEDKENGNILCQLYNDPSWKTIHLSSEEFKELQAWKFCDLLNRAYERGRQEAMEDLRRVIGIKE